MPDQYQIKRLQDALSQGGWKIKDFRQRNFEIISSHVKDSVLTLTFKGGKKAVSLNISGMKVHIDGEFGTGNSEPRKFEIKSEGGSMWLSFVRDKNAPPGWSLKPNYNRSRNFKYSLPDELRAGDKLADTQRVLSDPRQGIKGTILVHLTYGGESRWDAVPTRIPIALLE